MWPSDSGIGIVSKWILIRISYRFGCSVVVSPNGYSVPPVAILLNGRAPSVCCVLERPKARNDVKVIFCLHFFLWTLNVIAIFGLRISQRKSPFLVGGIQDPRPSSAPVIAFRLAFLKSCPPEAIWLKSF